MSDPPKNISPKKVLVSLNEWVSRKGTFSKNASKRGEFQIVKKTTCPVLLFENVCYSPLFEAFLEKVPFLETHSFRLTKTFVGDTFFGGSDEPP